MGNKRTLPWITALVLLSFGIFGGAISGSSSPDSHVDAVWVGHTGGALKIASADGELLFEIPDPDGIDSVAVDAESGRFWAASHGQVTAWSPFGEKLFSATLPQGKRERSELVLTADSLHNALWVARHDDLYRIDASGGVEQVLDFRQPISSLVLDKEDGRLWMATGAELSVYDLNGSSLTTGVYKGKQPLQALAFAPSQGELWGADQQRLYRFDDQGRKNLELKLNGIVHIAADGEGGVWVADRKRVYRVDRSGLIRSDSAPFQGRTGALIALDADRSDQTVWIVSQSRIAQLSPEGVVLRELPLDAISSGRQIRALAVYADTIAPEVTITAPTSGAYLNKNTPALTIEYSDVGVGVDPETLQIEVDDSAVAVDCDAQLETAVCVIVEPLPEGPISFTAKVDDRSGNTGISESVAITIDTIPPEITLSAPKNRSYTNDPQLGLSGLLSEAAKLTVNGDPVSLQSDHSFSFTTELEEGANTFDLLAIDYAGNRGEERLDVILDTQPPQVVAVDSVTVEFEADEAIVTGLPGSAEPGTTITVTNTQTGESVTVTVGEDGSFEVAITAQSGDALEVQVVDRAGNSSEKTQLSTSQGEPEPEQGFVPQDPAEIAPPLNSTAPTPFAEATEFLYTGNNRIQFDVESDTIQDYRAAVLRGRVTDRNGEPLSGVTITIHGHPQFGWSGTRADGLFDLAVNGGGVLTVNYKKEGYLPVQRKIDTPWEDYTWLPDVVMIGLDEQVTSIDLTADAPIQAARGSTVTDADGTRRATLLFPQGTQAHMVLPDGTTQTLDSLDVRATEYTVGDKGPEAMPGELPPTTGYTYAVELSVDEAIDAGAKQVRFDRAVPFYLENFLDFPVGGIVPTGWYDRDKAAWIPSDNGRVVEVLSITGGLADLDVDGSGNSADADSLADIGITEDERRELATLYEPGTTLWRTPVEHFTPWDCNWPYGPPDGAESPPDDEPEPADEDNPDDPTECDGCVIEAENQVLGESIPITGTPYTLNYRSNRMPGYAAGRTVDIPVSGASVPASLKRIDLTISVAGQVHHSTFAAAPDLRTRFVWDGKDGMGRPVQGSAELSYRLRFVYQAVYRSPSSFGSAFGQAGGSASIGRDRAASEIYFIREHTVTLTGAASTNDVGHWSLDAHHGYSFTGSILSRGDGSQHHAARMENIIDTVAGAGSYSYDGDGRPATQARLNMPIDIAPGPDGSLYIADGWNNRIRRVGPDGIITTVVGTGTRGDSGDGGPATQAQLNYPYGVALDPDGSLYIADTWNSRIRRVGPEGIITTVAGTGTRGDGGDGGPANQARLNGPWGVALGPDGSLYIADTGNHRIRRVGPDGIITTVAGTGTYGFSGDGGPATQAQLRGPQDVALGPDGSLYIVDARNHRIRRVGPEGNITTVAGTGSSGYGGDGGPATRARLYLPTDVAVSSGGIFYIAEHYNNRIRRVGPDGIISTVAGNGSPGSSGDGGPATRARLYAPNGVALGPDGNLYIADTYNNRIRSVSAPVRALAAGGFMVPSSDSGEYYVFDDIGTHLRTLDSLTGVQRHAFAYDAHRYLVQIEDADGNLTRIVRDAAGHPTALIAPDGQRTEVTLDANGYLAAVINPAGETYRMSYTAKGLLTAVEKPSGARFTYDYDSSGRLLEEQQPNGGGWTLARTKLEDGFETRLISGEGRTSRFRVEPLSETEVLRTTTAPDGTVSKRRITTMVEEITESTTAADGTRRTLHKVPDPRGKMDAPYVDAATVATPGGVSLSLSATRNATLANPDDPLSLTLLSESTTVNGRTSKAEFDAATLTWTQTSAQGRQSLVELNEKGRPVLVRSANLADIRYEYDSRGRLKALVHGEAGDPRSATLTYDPLGNLETVTDALERTTRFEYDLAGRVTKQTLPDGREIGYQYDANGNLTALTPPGREAHVFAYTPVDLEEQYTPPDLDGVDTITRYAYNKDKDLTRIDRPDGTAIQLGYNSGGKLATLTYPEGRLDYAYHLTTGKLAAITRADGHRLDYTYDGFLPLSETATGEVSGTIARTYDNNFWLTGLSVNGTSVRFGYDNDGLLTSAGSLSLSRDAANGLLTGTALGPVETEQTHNAFGELDSETVTVGGEPVLTTTYTRDKLGRITEKRETTGGTTTTWAYGYDTAGRLETVKTNGLTTATYTYDDNGNRLRKTTPNRMEEGAYDAQDRMVSYAGASYEYTENGELKAKTENGATTGYTYDALGNLLQVNLPGDMTIEYVIDGKNRRIGKKVNGQLVQGFLYQDQLNPIAELDGDGNIKARFVYGSKANVPDYMEKGGNTYRIISDHLGSPRLVIDTATGDVVQMMAYDEFGNVTEDTNPGFQPFGFAGGIYDQHTGLVRFGARDYEAFTGRWTAKDPIRFRGGDTSLYTYAYANPVGFIDPSGFEGEYSYNTQIEKIGSYMDPVGVESTARSDASGKVIGTLGDILTTMFPGISLESGTGYYNKTDTWQKVQVCRDSSSGQEVSRESIGQPYSAIDMSGTDVPGFTFDGDGVYSRETPIMGGYPVLPRVNIPQ